MFWKKEKKEELKTYHIDWNKVKTKKDLILILSSTLPNIVVREPRVLEFKHLLKER